MKGLLLKDLAIVKTQGRSVLIIMAIAIFLMISGENIAFAVVYSTMIFVMFGLTTLSYDAFDNGYAFLFSLPISRRIYVLEKYIFSLLSVAVGVCFGGIVLMIATYLQTNQLPASDEFSFMAGYAVGAMLFLALMLPVELKFGPEKGRIAMFVVFIAIMALSFFFKKMVENSDLNDIFLRLSQLKPMMIIGALGIVAIGVMVLSYVISCKIMMKKEF